MAVEGRRPLFTAEDFYRMAEAGILAHDGHSELVEGEVLRVPPPGRRQAACVLRLAQLLWRRLGEDALVAVRDPLRLGSHSEPRPELMLLRPDPDYYAAGPPVPEDVLLLVEVTQSANEADRRVRMPLYGRFGVSEAWLVDLQAGTVHVYRDPSPAGYGTELPLSPGDATVLMAFPEVEIAVDEVLV
jgi:Uma2 family endonuclease